MSKQPHQLEYNPEIGKRVREMTRAGVTIKGIFAAIQHMQYAPGSINTFNKYYRMDREAALAATTEVVGNKVVDQAINGDDDAPNTWKARELYLRSHGDWSPKTKEEISEVGSEEEETESAINALMKALGKDTEE